MESTSVYWIPIWRVLSPHFTLRLANPYFIKQLPGHKSDVKDALWIADCTLKNLVKEIHGRIINHHGKEVILASLTGVVSQAEIDVLRQLIEEIDIAESHRNECQKKMTEICEKHFPKELNRLQTIPGSRSEPPHH